VEEVLGVWDGGAMAEEDDLRLERRQLACGAAVLDRVGGQVRLRLVEAGESGQLVDVGEHVAQDEDAVGLAPEREMAGGVAWNVEHLEAGDLVARAELAVDGMAGPDEDAEVEARHRVTRLALADQVGVLGRVRIALADPEGD